MVPTSLRFARSVLHPLARAKVREMSTGIERVEIVCAQNVSVAKTLPAGRGRALSREQVAANFKPSEFSRRLNPRLEKDIANRWKVKVAQNPRLFNGSKFRRAGWEVVDGKLVLKIGLTNYRDLCGTNFAENCGSLMELGERELGDPQAYMADALGKNLVTDMIVVNGNVLVNGKFTEPCEFNSFNFVLEGFSFFVLFTV